MGADELGHAPGMPERAKDLIFFRLVKKKPGQNISDIADGVHRLPSDLLVVAPRRVVSINQKGRTIAVSAVTDTADAQLLKHTWVLAMNCMSWETLYSITLWQAHKGSRHTLAAATMDDLIPPRLRLRLPELMLSLHRLSAGGISRLQKASMSAEDRELIAILQEERLMAQVSETTRSIELKFTELGISKLQMVVDLSLVGRLLCGRPATEVDDADANVWELVVRLRQKGWTCLVPDHRAVLAPYDHNGAKHWYIRRSSTSICRLYLIALLSVTPTNGLRVQHFEKEQYYRSLLGLEVFVECWVLKLHRFAHPAEATRRLGGLEAWWHGGLEAWRQGSLRQAMVSGLMGGLSYCMILGKGKCTSEKDLEDRFG